MTNDEYNKFISENGYSSVNGQYRQYNQIPQTPLPNPQPPKKSGKAGFVAGIIAIALVVGGLAGFGGTVLGKSMISISNMEGYTGEVNSVTESQSTEQTTPKAPSSTIDESASADITPLDEGRIGDETNSTLLNGEELYAKVKNTVVLLYNYQYEMGEDEPQKASAGSGVVFTSDGYIITNAHVVAGAVKMTAVVHDYENDGETHEYEATVIGSDTATDLAVIKVDRDEEFQYAKLGDSDTVRVGQDVCVLGNPKLLISSFTKGIVSGLGRASYSGSSYGCSSIQIDASINSGNSGGAVFDMYGNVIGIVDYKLVASSISETSVEGIGFAITINEAKPVINDLMTTGYVTNRPGLGINGEAISEYTAKINGIPKAGVYVTYISEEKPVAKSGLRIGDVIVAIDDEDVSSLTDVQNEIAKHKIGETVVLTVYRSNELGYYRKTTVTVELSELAQN